MVCVRIAILFFPLSSWHETGQVSLLKTLDFFTSYHPSLFYFILFFSFECRKQQHYTFFPRKTVLRETAHWDVSRKLL